LGELDKSGIAELTFKGRHGVEDLIGRYIRMASHKLQKDWKAKLKSAVPFGLGQVKPKHFRNMGEIYLEKPG